MISLISVNYFSAEQCIHAITPFLNLPEYEIIIIDNSCSRTEHDILRHSAARHCNIVFNNENAGFGRACNQGYSMASGDFIFLLNPDACISTDTAASLINFLKHNNNAGAVCPLLFWDRDGLFRLPPNTFPSWWYIVLESLAGPALAWFYGLYWHKKSLKIWRSTRPVKQKNLSGGLVFLKRTAIEKAGGLFNPDYFMYFEDTDLFFRMRHAGIDLFLLPSCRAFHAFSGCAPHMEAWKKKMMQESAEKFMNKTFPYARKLRQYLPKTTHLDLFPHILQNRITHLGTLRDPPVFSVPPEAGREWTMEWSPNPFFYPSAYMKGRGNRAGFPENVWPIIPHGDSFVRFSSWKNYLAKPLIWHWTTVNHSTSLNDNFNFMNT